MDICDTYISTSLLYGFKRTICAWINALNTIKNNSISTSNAIGKVVGLDYVNYYSSFMWPLLIINLLECFHQMFQLSLIWFYVGSDSLPSYECAYSLIYLFNNMFPKAVAQAAAIKMTVFLSDNQVKRADEVYTYQLLNQAILLAISMIVALSFGLEGDTIFLFSQWNTKTDYFSNFMGFSLSVNTLTEILGSAQTIFFLFENDPWFYLITNGCTQLLQFGLQQLCYQYQVTNGKTPSLLPLAFGKAIGAIPLIIYNIVRFQDFILVLPSVIRFKHKQLQIFKVKEFIIQLIQALIRGFEMAVQPIVFIAMHFYTSLQATHATNYVQTHFCTYIYQLAIQIVLFPSQAYMFIFQNIIGFNLLNKKYIRTKEILITLMIWPLILVVITSILSVYVIYTLIFICLPALMYNEVQFYMEFANYWLVNITYWEFFGSFYQYACIYLALEQKWIHEIIGIAAYLVTTIIVTVSEAILNGDFSILTYMFFYGEIGVGVASALIIILKMIEIMQLAKIELRRMKKKKKLEGQEDLAIKAEK